jgi:holo-[acyl-carrier protein] synthase
MILGTGIDIVEVARIRRSLEKFGDHFMRRILRPDEMTYCLGHKFPEQYVAARFAAKEAISKAFGTGIGAEIGWQDIEIGRKESGEPFVILHREGQKLLRQRSASTVHLSLSHTSQHAAAVAILEGA